MKNLFSYSITLSLIFVLISCGKRSEIQEYQILEISPLNVFDEELNEIYLTDISLTTDSSNVFFVIPSQGLVVKTDAALNFISGVDGKFIYPDFDFPSNVVVKDNFAFIEDIAYQNIYKIDKNNFELYETYKLPIASMGIKLDISKTMEVLYSFIPSNSESGLATYDLNSQTFKTSNNYMPSKERFRALDQVRLGCFCEGSEKIMSIGRFLPHLEILSNLGNIEHQFDLSNIEPLTRAYDTLLQKRKNIPDFEFSSSSQNIITSLDCFDDKILIGFTDLIGVNRENVRHLALLKIDNDEINVEKIIRLRTGNDDEKYHFISVKYNPNNKRLYAQGFETFKIYVFEVDLLN